MKKLFLSLSIIAALTVGTGAMVFAAEEDGVTTQQENSNLVEDKVVGEDENSFTGAGNPNCPYYGEGYQGQGSRNGEGYQGQCSTNREGNRYGVNGEVRGGGSCGRGMTGTRFNDGVQK